MSGPLILSSGLTVLIDPAVPESYLAMAPTLRLIEDLSLLPTWLPIRSSLPKASARANETPYQARRRRAREQYAARERERYFGGLQENAVGDANLGRAALLWCAEHGDPAAFCSTLLPRIWVGGEAFVDAVPAVLNQQGIAAGFEVFAAGAAPQQDALDAEITELGLYRGPAYVVNGETFQGREHLPLIYWRLSGEVGSPPL